MFSLRWIPSQQIPTPCFPQVPPVCPPQPRLPAPEQRGVASTVHCLVPLLPAQSPGRPSLPAPAQLVPQRRSVPRRVLPLLLASARDLSGGVILAVPHPHRATFTSNPTAPLRPGLVTSSLKPSQLHTTTAPPPSPEKPEGPFVLLVHGNAGAQYSVSVTK